MKGLGDRRASLAYGAVSLASALLQSMFVSHFLKTFSVVHGVTTKYWFISQLVYAVWNR